VRRFGAVPVLGSNGAFLPRSPVKTFAATFVPGVFLYSKDLIKEGICCCREILHQALRNLWRGQNKRPL
jgi:hypothetical protein